MSETRAQHMANEWWWYVLRYAKKHPTITSESATGINLLLMIRRDILQCEPHLGENLAYNTAKDACTILRERLETERKGN